MPAFTGREEKTRIRRMGKNLLTMICVFIDVHIELLLKSGQYSIHFFDTPDGILNAFFLKTLTGGIKYFFERSFPRQQKEVLITHRISVYYYKESHARARTAQRESYFK